MKVLLKLALTALAFMFLLPMIPGIEFHGGFGTALLISLFFGFMLWIVDLVALAFGTFSQSLPLAWRSCG